MAQYEGIAQLYTHNNNNVPVCWDTAGFTREKNFIRNIIANTWARESSLQFTWRDTCPTSGTEKFLKIGVVSQAKDGNGTYPNHGADGVAFRLGLDSLRPTGDSRSLQFSVRPDGLADQGRVEYLAVHEFGHALGFFHEQERPDNGGRCTLSATPVPGGIYQSEYDQNSIMNYCQAGGNSTGAITMRDVFGFRQVYARPDVHVVGVSGSGGLFHALRRANGTWTAFGDVEGAVGDIGTPTKADLRYTRNGAVHLAATTSAGGLYHTIRAFSGTWQPFGNIEAVAGEIGTPVNVSMADVDDDVHMVVVNSAGSLYHAIRTASTWTAFTDVESVTGEVGTFVDVAASSALRNVHVCGVTADNRLWHATRLENGAWTAFGDVEGVIGEVGAVSTVDCTVVSENLHIVGSNTNGDVFHAVRFANGNWSGAGWVEGAAGNVGTVSGVASSQAQGELHLTVRTLGTLFHTVRNASGNWTTFGEVPRNTTFSDVGME